MRTLSLQIESQSGIDKVRRGKRKQVGIHRAESGAGAAQKRRVVKFAYSNNNNNNNHYVHYSSMISRQTVRMCSA